MDGTDATLIGARDAALLALGYVFALRRSELVALDLETQGSGDGVLRITARTMEVAFAISKTSTGEAQTVAVPRIENAEAVQAVETWIRLAGIKSGRRPAQARPKGRQDRRPASSSIGREDHQSPCRSALRRPGSIRGRRCDRGSSILWAQLASGLLRVGGRGRGRPQGHGDCQPPQIADDAHALLAEGRTDPNVTASIARCRSEPRRIANGDDGSTDAGGSQSRPRPRGTLTIAEAIALIRELLPRVRKKRNIDVEFVVCAVDARDRVK